MRIKRITWLLALVLCISAFAMPMTAFAAGSDTTPPTLKATLDGDTLRIESSDDNSGVEAVFIDGNRVNSLVDGCASVNLKDYAGNNKRVSVYAVDYAGNRSETVKLDNPYYQAPVTQTPPTAPSSGSGSGNTQSQTPAPTQRPSTSPSGSGNTQNSGNGKQAMVLLLIREIRRITVPVIRLAAVRQIRIRQMIRMGPYQRSRRALLPRKGPARCWTRRPALTTSIFTPSPPRTAMCST